MIAYSKESLDKRQLHTVIEQLTANKLLSADDAKNIRALYPDDLYSPAVFVRTGFGVLTLIASLAIFGILLLMSGGNSIGAVCLLMGAVSVLGLEYFIREKKHYHSGVDDMLLHLSIIYIVAGFSLLGGTGDRYLFSVASFGAAAGCTVGALRYLNRLSAALVPVSSCFFIWSLFPGWGIPLYAYLLTAVAMAALLYFFTRLSAKGKWPYHAGCLLWARIATVAAIYASLHYHTYAITHYPGYGAGGPGEAPMAWILFLWAWTILFPFGILLYGIRRASGAWIRVAMAAILSLGYFYHRYLSVFDPATGAILLGLALICIAAWLILWLQQKRSAHFVYEPGSQSDGLLVPVSLIAMSRLPGPAAGDEAARFGGGSFGGGGAGSDF